MRAGGEYLCPHPGTRLTRRHDGLGNGGQRDPGVILPGSQPDRQANGQSGGAVTGIAADPAPGQRHHRLHRNSAGKRQFQRKTGT